MCKVLLLLGILLWSGFLDSLVLGLNTEPNSPSALTNSVRTSVAYGTYGCSFKFFKHYCWRYCTGDSGKWCYTVQIQHNHCTSDNDCYYESRECAGWCAWNSQSGCSKACHEQITTPRPERPGCRKGMPYWMCQSEYGDYWGSRMAMEAKWISPDIPNERVLNTTGNTIEFNGNKITSTKESTSSPQSALWIPIGTIKISPSTFYWTFSIRELGTSTGSTIYVGVSDLNKLAPGWSTSGLFYGGNLSDGSGLLIGNFGPKLKVGDKVSIVIKLLDSRMKVYIVLNDQPLGLAFDVPETTLNGIYPAVKFTGKGSIKIEERNSADIPAQLEPVKLIGLEGNWTLQTLEDKATFDTKVTMKITQISDRVYDRAYRVRIHVFNKFIGSLIEKSTSNWSGEIIDKTDLKRATEQMELERKIFEHISGIGNLVFDTVKSELRIESKDSTSVWKQTEPKLSFVNWNPFKRRSN